MDLQIIGIIFGCIILAAVVYKYLQKDAKQPLALSCFLSFLGFALVASPAWTNISFKSSEIEIQLINEATKQMDDYVKIIDGYNSRAQAKGLKWETGNNGSQQQALNQLARQLEMQKNKVKQALSENNIELAMKETQKGSEIIATIAKQVEG
ncbi:hypothetical protein [Aliikangiella sp. IMCC44359]|uniref:hypothetical protein n=1 Tax=Aliikangiella sp. IMCC44359 TaxID=3459125 RepID=UPI00403AA3FB